MLTLPEHLTSPLFFIEVHVVLSFVPPYFKYFYLFTNTCNLDDKLKFLNKNSVKNKISELVVICHRSNIKLPFSLKLKYHIL